MAIEGDDETQHSDIIRQAKSAISHNQDPLIGLKLGAFTILEKIADGGMAAVYKGKREQNDFEHWAAIKVLHSPYQSTAMLESFHFERRTLAAFEHAHIAKVFDGGTALNDLPFLTMELIDGLPIDHYCETKQLSVEQIFELFLQLCEALDYAHRRLIVHRDIKPSNVLVTAEGQAKLIDFGIAKEIDLGGESADLTAAGQRALTPTYASPEQVSGKPITIATDIYSLGILLYKLLTTNLPYKSDNSLQLIEAICKDYPTSPSEQITILLSDDEYIATQSQPALRYLQTTKKKIKGDVDNIVLKAINKDPNDRYASINEFSSDIRRFLAGEAVIARGNSFSYKLSKWIKRNKMITLLTCSVFFSFFSSEATRYIKRDN